MPVFLLLRRLIRRASWLAAISLLIGATIGVTPVRAVGLTWTVDSTGDASDNAPGDILCKTNLGTCTLRAAIQNVNHIDPGAGNHHTIKLPAGTITQIIIGDGEDAAITGDYDVLHSVTIEGAGAGQTIIQGSTTNADAAIDRIFDIQGLGVTFVLRDVTVRRGFSHLGNGGAINVASNTANVTLDGVVLSGNRANDALGGAVLAKGALTILDSTISGNHSDGGPTVDFSGGGITVRRSSFTDNTSYSGALRIRDDATGVVERSTFSGTEYSGPGAAVALQIGKDSNDLTEVTVRNSTFSGNFGFHEATIVASRKTTVDIESSTIAGNKGYGLSGAGGTTLHNTLLAANTEGNCSELPGSSDHSIDTGTTCHLEGTGDIVNGTAALGALVDNGGPTRTMALGKASDARDAGSNCPDIDQRGRARPKDGDGDGVARCDIGAFEAATVALVTPGPSAEVTAAPTTLPTGAATASPTATDAASAAASVDPGASVAPSGAGASASDGGAATPAASGDGIPIDSGGPDLSSTFAIVVIVLVVVFLFFAIGWLRRRGKDRRPA